MDKVDLFRLLDMYTPLSKGTRFQRLRKLPTRLLYSKILDLLTLSLKMPLSIKARTFWDEYMVVVIPELVSLSIYRYGFFEEGLTKMMLEYLKPGMTFLDIGAHFGYFTLLGSLIVGHEGKVHSFEPTPSSFDVLRTNASRKNNVYLNNCAVLSGKKEFVSLNDYGIRYSAFNSMHDPRLPRNVLPKLRVGKYRVESTSIDDYAEKNSVTPEFIKIDAESSEYEILLGMENTIAKARPVISMEVGDLGVRGAPPSKALIDFLTDRGYQYYTFADGVIIKPSLAEGKHHNSDNLLFLPV
jgi:FkbM family methyltransferase